jgi:hypothetical protein
MKQKDWFRAKGYAHFSKKINKNFATSFVKNVASVSGYAFYPLIHQILNSRRYKKIDDCAHGKKRAHSYFTTSGAFKITSKQRKIYYASHLDSQIYSYYANEILGIKYENNLKKNTGLSACISAYRRIPTESDQDKNKGNIHFAKDVFDEIKKRGNCAVIAFDITEFFDSLDHNILKKAWEDLLETDRLPSDHYNIYKSLTNCSYVKLDDLLKELKISHPNEVFRQGIHQYLNSRTTFKKTVKDNNLIKKHPFKNKTTGLRQGIPQGTPISAFLANLYLLKFDTDLYNICLKHDSFYRRYSDDIVIITSEEKNLYFKNLVISHIDDFNLEIQESKTQTRFFRNDPASAKLKVHELSKDGTLKPDVPLDYLGFEFDGVKPLLKKSSISKYYREAKTYTYKRVRLAAKEQKFKFLQPDIHKRVFKRKIYKLFTHQGTHGRKRNYILYANEASEIFGEPAIKKQLSKSWNIINRYLVEKIKTKKIVNFNSKRPLTKM